MTKEEKRVLLALCIGDGYVREKTNGVTKMMYGEFSVTHCPEQLAYLEWKLNKIHSILGGKKPKIYSQYRRQSKDGKRPLFDKCIKKGHPYFKVLRRFLYQNGVKTLRRQVLNKLSLLGIIIWYLDDGSLNKLYNRQTNKIKTYHVKISLKGNYSQIVEIQTYFKEVWNLNWRINKTMNQDNYVLRMGKHEGEKFLKLIYPFVKAEIPSMLYKVDASLNTRAQKADNTAKI
ncbi:MAG: hypothetical protein KGJ87_08805 [Planctomycetota bacterium]|nr:hypothetical protein [Planctomycetota bacterium]MDE2217240.1 hypothetical protein [Planctomycetota bacterium]